MASVQANESQSLPTLTKLQLPQELIDEIIANLHDDKGTLRCCSSTSKAFSVSASRHLHKEVTIDYSFFDPKSDNDDLNYDQDSLKRRGMIFVSSSIGRWSHIGCFIQNLTIQPFSGAGWVQADTSLFLGFVSNLRNLRVLVLRFVTFSSLKSVPEEGRTPSIPNFEGGLGIEKLEAELVDFQDVFTFNHIVSLFSSIKILDIQRCFSCYATQRSCGEEITAFRSTLVATSQVSILKLRLNYHDTRLISGGDSYLLCALQNHIRASKHGLSLHITLYNDYKVGVGYLHPFMDQLGPFITSLFVRVDSDSYKTALAAPSGFLHDLEGHQFPDLRRISLPLDITSWNSEAYQWDKILLLLGVFSGCASIVSVTIYLVDLIIPDLTSRNSLLESLYSPKCRWSDLDQALKSFPSLRSVEFTVIDAASEEDQDMVDEVRRYFSVKDLWIVRKGYLIVSGASKAEI